ncbi:hypothetical protein CKO15_11310 [Halorhodospira abdelmalekii]|nr:hypothetical protein [Halorhodospira abdelmalekii]
MAPRGLERHRPTPRPIGHCRYRGDTAMPAARLTLEEVRSAVLSCLGECLAPSADRLIERIGHGSKTTVLKLRAQVLEELRDHFTGHVPSGFPEALHEPLEAFWYEAQRVAHDELAEQRQRLEQERARLGAEHEQMQREIAAADARTEQARQERIQAEQLTEERARQIEQLRQERDEARQETAALRREHEAERREWLATHEQTRERLEEQIDSHQRAAQELEAELTREREHREWQEQQYIARFNEVSNARDAANQALKEAQAWHKKVQDELRAKLETVQSRCTELDAAQRALEQERAQWQAEQQRWQAAEERWAEERRQWQEEQRGWREQLEQLQAEWRQQREAMEAQRADLERQRDEAKAEVVQAREERAQVLRYLEGRGSGGGE